MFETLKKRRGLYEADNQCRKSEEVLQSPGTGLAGKDYTFQSST